MHELSLAMEIIDLVRPNIPAGEHLKSVQITVGLLAGVCCDSLQFCFSELAGIEGHPGAELKMVATPAAYSCLSCNYDYVTRSVEQGCPVCGSMMRKMRGGTEFFINSIEV